MTISTNIARQHNATNARNINTIQRYAGILEGILKNNFPLLYSAPDSLYVMLATMGLESSFNILHLDKNGNVTPNHSPIKTSYGIGKSYWFDPIIVPKKSDPSLSVQQALIDGLSAKALMGTMGMYQVRNTKESNNVMSIGGSYLGIAESNGLMVDAGISPASIFTNDDTGAIRSMIMGGIIMEGKYINRLKKYTPGGAIQAAIGDYLGRVGSKDILGTSPSLRLAAVNDPDSGIAKKLSAAGFTKRNSNKVFIAKTPTPQAGTETKLGTDATSNNPPIPQNGC